MEQNQPSLILFMPSIEGGGVEKNLIVISNFLSKKISEIKLITFDSKFNHYFNKKIKIINFTKKSKRKYSKYYKYFICLIILIKELKKKKSLVLAFQANIYCCFLSLILKFNLITRSNSSPAGWSNNLLKNLIYKVLIKIPCCVIVNSKDFKKEFDQKFCIKSKLIYNPLNKKNIIKLSKKKINFNFFNKTKLKIINIARFTDQKDHLTLIKAMSLIKKNKINFKLLLIGYGINKVKIIKLIKKYNLIKEIKILNYQNNPYNYLLKSNLFILSSIYEGLPNVLLEAMTLKKFVISSNCPTGPREILQNGKLGLLFKIGDYKSLSKKIIQFTQNKRRYNRVAKKGFLSLDRFEYDKNCRKYLTTILKFI